MKTKLLKRWRNEAWNRIGVFKQDNGKYRIVFDRSLMGDVSDYDKYPSTKDFQVVCKDIENFSEAVERCDNIRREFILREARAEAREKTYGTANRIY